MHAFLTYIGEDVMMIDSIRCLALLLTSTKVKNSSGDIPYVVKFVPVSYGIWLLTNSNHLYV